MSQGEAVVRRGGLSVIITDLLTEEQWAKVSERFEGEGVTGAATQGFDGVVLRHLAKITGWPSIVHKGEFRGTAHPWARICLDAVRDATDGNADRATVMLNLIQRSDRWAYRPMTDRDRFPSFLQAMLADVGAGVGIAANRLAPTAAGMSYRPSRAVLKLLEETNAASRRRAEADELAEDAG